MEVKIAGLISYGSYRKEGSMKRKEDDFLITLIMGAILGSIVTFALMTVIRVFFW